MGNDRALVIENDPTDDLGRLGPWLVEGGLEPAVLRPHAGAEISDTLDGYAALVVLGGAGVATLLWPHFVVAYQTGQG